jgi:hypothetical protein
MGAAASVRERRQLRVHPAPRQVTLLELVAAVADSADDDREVVATVLHMLRSGSVMLCGNFRNESLDSFDR